MTEEILWTLKTTQEVFITSTEKKCAYTLRKFPAVLFCKMRCLFAALGACNLLAVIVDAFVATHPQLISARYKAPALHTSSGRRKHQAQIFAVTKKDLEEAEHALFSRHNLDSAAVMNALLAPCISEQSPVPIFGVETLPADLPGGALLRIGPNPKPGDPCPAFLDGDGMVNAIVIPPPERRGAGEAAWYGRAWVRAAGFSMEEARNRTLFDGVMCAPRGWPVLAAMFGNLLRTGQAIKDTANTALSFHAGARTSIDLRFAARTWQKNSGRDRRKRRRNRRRGPRRRRRRFLRRRRHFLRRRRHFLRCRRHFLQASMSQEHLRRSRGEEGAPSICRAAEPDTESRGVLYDAACNIKYNMI